MGPCTCCSGSPSLTPGRGARLRHALRRVVAPDLLISAGLGLLFGKGLGQLLHLGTKGGFILGGLLGRAGYGLTEQVVPFSQRRHVILLPIAVELTLGAVMFEKFRMEQKLKRKLVPESDRDFKLVRELADRIIAAVKLGQGGGFQAHVERFNWEVIVVREDTCNAFVMPGGKIVVYTGLIKLMKRDKDMLAMVMGHEVAHALARHSNENIGFGIFCMLGVQMLVASLVLHRKRKPPVVVAEEEEDPSLDERTRARLAMLRDAAAQQAAAAAPPTEPPRWLNEHMLNAFTSVFLSMPFSRRAETEADLVGLKLMRLAGYNTSKAPTTFEVLDTAGGGGEDGRAGNNFWSAMAAAAAAADPDEQEVGGNNNGAAAVLSAAVNLGCTHPRGQTRVRLLERELEAMRTCPGNWSWVHMPVDYWSL